jgi:hypothetical protein
VVVLFITVKLSISAVATESNVAKKLVDVALSKNANEAYRLEDVALVVEALRA